MKTLIKFNYLGAEHKIGITPEASDWWTSVDGFDIHYCENYNEVCIYLEGTYECIHKQSIEPIETDPISYEDVVNVCSILNKDLSVEEMEEVLRRYNQSYEDDIWSAKVENIIYNLISERQ
jgi:hypothetical protein